MKSSFVLRVMRCIAICGLLLSSFFASAQSLLLNGSFEEENICLEYHVNCAPEAWLTDDVSYNHYYKGDTRAYDGTHFMSFEASRAGRRSTRTMIRTQLLCWLRKGNKYRVSMHVKSRHHILDSIGIYFSQSDPLFERTPLHLNKPALLLTDNLLPLKKDSSWQEVAFEYIARGDESFMAITNFSKNNIAGETGIPSDNRFLVYVDAVSLTPLNPHEMLCDDVLETMEKIYDQDERHDMLHRLIRNRRAFQPIPLVLERNKIIYIDTLILQEVLFATGKATLQPESYRLLDSFCRKVVGKNVDSVIVEGHTDNAGPDEMNNRLSAARVQTVLDYFAGRAFVKPGRIVPRAWGETRPVATNATPQGRQRNRRVEVLVYLRE